MKMSGDPVHSSCLLYEITPTRLHAKASIQSALWLYMAVGVPKAEYSQTLEGNGIVCGRAGEKLNDDC
jgi:hypothetical protein